MLHSSTPNHYQKRETRYRQLTNCNNEIYKTLHRKHVDKRIARALTSLDQLLQDIERLLTK